MRSLMRQQRAKSSRNKQISRFLLKRFSSPLFLRVLVASALTLIGVAPSCFAGAVVVTSDTTEFTTNDAGVEFNVSFTTDQEISSADDQTITVQIPNFVINAVTSFTGDEFGDLVQTGAAPTTADCSAVGPTNTQVYYTILPGNDSVQFLICPSVDELNVVGTETIANGSNISIGINADTSAIAASDSIILSSGAGLALSSAAGSSILNTTNPAADRYVDASNVAATDTANDCDDYSTPCLTVEHAISQANETENVYLGPGFYLGGTIDKSVNILGDSASVFAGLGSNNTITFSTLEAVTATALQISNVMLTGSAPTFLAEDAGITLTDVDFRYETGEGCFTTYNDEDVAETANHFIINEETDGESVINFCGGNFDLLPVAAHGYVFQGNAVTLDISGTTFDRSGIDVYTSRELAKVEVGQASTISFTDNTIAGAQVAVGLGMTTYRFVEEGGTFFNITSTPVIGTALDFANNVFGLYAEYGTIVNAGGDAPIDGYFTSFAFNNNTINSDLDYILNLSGNTIEELQLNNNSGVVSRESGSGEAIFIDGIESITGDPSDEEADNDTAIHDNRLPFTSFTLNGSANLVFDFLENVVASLEGDSEANIGTSTTRIARNTFVNPDTAIYEGIAALDYSAGELIISNNRFVGDDLANISLTAGTVIKVFNNTVLSNSAIPTVLIDNTDELINELIIKNNNFVFLEYPGAFFQGAITCTNVDGTIETVDIDYNNFDYYGAGVDPDLPTVENDCGGPNTNDTLQFSWFESNYASGAEEIIENDEKTITVTHSGDLDFTNYAIDGDEILLLNFGGNNYYFYVLSATLDTITLLNYTGFGINELTEGAGITVGNLMLSSLSPLINSGDASDEDIDDIDYNGNARIQEEGIDIGHVETAYVPPTVSETTVTGQVVSWTFTDDDGFGEQQQYQVIVTQGEDVFEDSGRITSAISEYTIATPLVDCTEYEVTVNAYNLALGTETVTHTTLNCPEEPEEEEPEEEEPEEEPAGSGGGGASAGRVSNDSSEKTNDPTQETEQPASDNEPQTDLIQSPINEEKAGDASLPPEANGVTGSFKIDDTRTAIYPAPNQKLEQYLNSGRDKEENKDQSAGTQFNNNLNLGSLIQASTIGGLNTALKAGTDTQAADTDPTKNAYSPETIFTLLASEFKSGDKESASQMQQLAKNAQDSDEDGLTDEMENIVLGTNPKKADTDKDGVNDGLEIFGFNTDPTKENKNLSKTIRVNYAKEIGQKHQLRAVFGKKVDVKIVNTYVEIDGELIALGGTKCSENGVCLIDIDLRKQLGDQENAEVRFINEFVNSDGELVDRQVSDKVNIRLNRLSDGETKLLEIGGTAVDPRFPEFIYIVRGNDEISYKTDYPAVVESTASLVHGSFAIIDSLNGVRKFKIPSAIAKQPGVHTFTVMGYNPETKSYGDPIDVSFIVRQDYLAPFGNARLSLFEPGMIAALVATLAGLAIAGYAGLKFAERRKRRIV